MELEKQEELTIKILKKDIIYLSVFMSIIVILIIITVVFVLLSLRDLNSFQKIYDIHKENHKTWFQGVFPESEFKITDDKLSNEYFSRVQRGYSVCKQYNIVIGCLVYNCEDILLGNFHQIEKFGKLFKSYKIVVLDYGSSDKTREVLNYIVSKNLNLEIVPYHSIGSNILNFQKMNIIRNCLLNFIKLNHSNCDYYSNIDLTFRGVFSLDGLVTCFSYKNWTGISSYGVSYNLENFKTNDLIEYDTINMIDLAEQPKSINVIYKIEPKSARYKRGEKPVQVRSSYGGCIIYDLKSILDINATYLSEEFSDHVALNLKLHDSEYKIFINPSFLFLHSNTDLLKFLIK